MEDFLPLPAFHTMSIIIPRQITPTLVFEPTELASQTQNSIPKGLVLQISGNSSGFILAKPTRPFLAGAHQISALVITAAHSVMNVFTKTFRSDSFKSSLEFSWETNPPVFCIPLLHYLNDNEVTSIASTNINYMCSNDIALLGLAGAVNFSELIACDIAQDTQEGSRCVVSGYPDFKSTGCVFPGGRGLNKAAVEHQIKSVFHNFAGRVNSFGDISHANQNIIEIRCSATAGMSGSPLLLQNNNKLEIAGVYVGGPPLPLQYEALCLAQKVYQTKRYDPDELIPLIEKVRTEYNDHPNIKTFLECFSALLESFVISPSDQEFKDVEDIVTLLINKVVSSHPCLSGGPKLDYYFNVALPVNHGCLIKAINIREKFRKIDTDFASTEELIQYLLK